MKDIALNIGLSSYFWMANWLEFIQPKTNLIFLGFGMDFSELGIFKISSRGLTLLK